MRFVYNKNNGYLCIEIFETMQSSVTRSRTSITKSLPASLKYYYKLLYHKKLQQNTKFFGVKPLVSKVETKSFKRLKLSECTVDLIDLTARFNHINHISYSD